MKVNKKSGFAGRCTPRSKNASANDLSTQLATMGQALGGKNATSDVELAVERATCVVAQQRESSKSAEIFSRQHLERWEHKRRRQTEKTTEIHGSANLESTLRPDSLSSTQDWEINSDCIHFEKKAAAGSTSIVWLAKYKEQPVAVKQPFALIAEKGVTAEFAREVEVLSQLAHPYIVRFIGLCHKAGTACIVTEWYPRNMLDWLQHHDCTKDEDFTRAVTILLQISQGMQYLHDQRIAHMDLKPTNVLLSSDSTPCIADFGLSILYREADAAVAIVEDLKLGSPAYMSPEALSGCKDVSKRTLKKCDVYSFGMLVWAIFVGEEPFKGCRFGYEVVEAVVTNKKMPSLDRVPARSPATATIRIMIEKCWHRNPRRRPSFESIVSDLRAIVTSL